MSMTRKEATHILKIGSWWDCLPDDMSDADMNPLQDALDVALEALRPITREQVEKMRGEIVETVENGRMKRVFSCCGCDFTSLTCWITPKFCPSCGSPLTDEAVEMVMKRLEEMQND